MPKNQLKGKFNLSKFKGEVAQAKDYTDMPKLEYTIGEGETLDYLFDTLVTYRPLHANRSIERQFKGDMGYNKPLATKSDLKGETLYLDISWLTNSEGIPKDVEDAIDEAEERMNELIEKKYRRH